MIKLTRLDRNTPLLLTGVHAVYPGSRGGSTVVYYGQLFEVKESILEVESVWHDSCFISISGGDDDYNNNITNSNSNLPRPVVTHSRIQNLQILFDGEMITVEVDPTCDEKYVRKVFDSTHLQAVIAHWFGLHEERYGDIPPIIPAKDMGVLCALEGKANGFENGKRLLTWLFTSDHSRAVWYRENMNLSPVTVLNKGSYANCLAFEAESVLKQKPKNQSPVHRFDADGNLI